MKNPYSLSFGKEPISEISRAIQENEIIDDLNSENPSSHVYMITGVRGSGKTVFMTKISKEFSRDETWIVIDAIPETNIIEYIVAKLQANSYVNSICKEFKLSISIPGVELSFGGKSEPIKNPAIALEKIVESISSKNKKLLICIDEVIVNKNIKEFVSLFQVMIRKENKIFLLMTGLFENIYVLQNEKTLTFLYRAPRIILKPLNQNRIALNYKDTFNLTDDESKEMSSVTNGYPFAYQVLGYLCFKDNKKWNEVLSEYDLYLEEYVYEKIWSELSPTDKKVLISICNNYGQKNDEIRKHLKMTSNSFNLYRTRLIRKGVLESVEYGYLSFALPRFIEYINRIK